MDTSELKTIAKQFRKDIFKFKVTSTYGHLASSLSPVDILVSLYMDDETLFDHNRDIMLFGKGHGSPAVYPILAHLGYFPSEELELYCTTYGILRLHSDSSIPGCHYVGGSLGNALGYAAGLAYADRDRNIYVMLGDAELYEGANWESLMFINHHKLKNIRIIVDRNEMGILAKTEESLKLEPLSEKFIAFGFNGRTVNGHDFDELREVFSYESAQVVICNTVKAKGVSYLEGRVDSHSNIPKTKELIQQGLEELS